MMQSQNRKRQRGKRKEKQQKIGEVFLQLKIKETVG